MTPVRPRQLFRHGSVYALTSFVTAAMSFAVLPVYAAVVGDEGLGLIEVLAAGGVISTVVVSQGLAGAWFRLRLDYEGPQRRRFEATILWYLAACSVVLLGALALVGPPLAARLTPEVPFYPLWFLVVGGSCAAAWSDIYTAGLQAQQRTLAFAAFVIGRRVLVLGSILVFVLGLQRGAPGKVEGEVLATVSLAVVVLLLLRPGLPDRDARPMLVRALRFGLPLLPHGLALQIIAVSDRIVLSHMLGLGAVGVYSMGYRIGAVVETFNAGLAVAYQSVIVSRAKSLRSDGDVVGGYAELARLGALMIAGTSLVAQSIAFVSLEALRLMGLGDSAFSESWRVTYVVSAGLLAHCAYAAIVVPLSQLHTTTARIPLISLCGAVVNLGACVAMIPHFGMMAAAWSTLAAYASMAVVAHLQARNVVPTPHRFGTWSRVFGLTACVLVAGHAVDERFAAWLPRLLLKGGILVASTLLTFRIVEMPLAGVLNLLPGRTPTDHPPAI